MKFAKIRCRGKTLQRASPDRVQVSGNEKLGGPGFGKEFRGGGKEGPFKLGQKDDVGKL